MSEKKVETVTLVAPNGATVTVAADKVPVRLAGGYKFPEKPATAPKSKPAPKV